MFREKNIFKDIQVPKSSSLFNPMVYSSLLLYRQSQVLFHLEVLHHRNCLSCPMAGFLLSLPRGRLLGEVPVRHKTLLKPYMYYTMHIALLSYILANTLVKSANSKSSRTFFDRPSHVSLVIMLQRHEETFLIERTIQRAAAQLVLGLCDFLVLG